MLHRFLFIAALLGYAGLTQAGEAGRIIFVAGDVQVAGQRAALNGAVNEGDEIATGSDGYAYLKTVDSGFLILRPNSRAHVVAYHIDQQDPAGSRIKIELLNGVARSISGEAVKRARQNFRFNTPVAAIGVRGTDFTVFTDQKTTRIAVLSGGIVASSFSATCGPEGSGPCEGFASRELFAGQQGWLQVERGQEVPQLLRGNGHAPDQIAPPRSDEPAMPVAAIPVVGATPADSMPPAAHETGLELKKNNDLLFTLDTAPAPDIAPVDTVSVRTILWGRWQPLARQPADADALAQLESGAYMPASAMGSFLISRLKDSGFVLPNQGSASFALTGSEAYLSTGGLAPVAATIQNAHLDVDFAARAFATSLQVVAAGAQVDLYARGDITLQGKLVSYAQDSNARVAGYLGGASAREAGYLFQSTGSTSQSAFGATQWAR